MHYAVNNSEVSAPVGPQVTVVPQTGMCVSAFRACTWQQDV